MYHQYAADTDELKSHSDNRVYQSKVALKSRNKLQIETENNSVITSVEMLGPLARKKNSSGDCVTKKEEYSSLVSQ